MPVLSLHFLLFEKAILLHRIRDGVVGKAITALFVNSEVVERRIQATKLNILSGMRGHAYLHFFCHGNYDWDNPLESGLTVADGRLTLKDLQHEATVLSAARLVTLAACETGMLDVTKDTADEYIGLPAGFMQVGVPCIVSSLWEVEQLPTGLLIERFYQNHLTKGMDLITAMREAQVWLREMDAKEVEQCIEGWYVLSGKRDRKLYLFLRYYRSLAHQEPRLRPFAHPYYWAAFTVNGA